MKADTKPDKQVLQKKEKKFLISVVDDAKWKLIWDLLIIVTALYSVIVIPIKIGVNRYILGQAYDYIDLFTYFLYLFDLIINFRTTYINSQGVEIKEIKLIRKRYACSMRFIYDLISLLNFPMMGLYLGDYKSLRDFA